ncbi:MAG TPA: HAMP domain-containing sensor histidine kinase [Pirellulales bacterium]|nr:HAMP domain-containing sensor histidine kinase [Pirellulales bacterium]
MFSKWPIRIKLRIGLGLLLGIVITLSWSAIHGLYAYRSLVRSLSRRVLELPKANDLNQSVTDLRVALADDDAPTSLGDPRSPGQGPSARRHWAKTEFSVQLQRVEHTFDDYRRQLAENPDRGGISDNALEWDTVDEIEAALARIKTKADRDADWLFDPVLESKLNTELNELQRLTASLPMHLYLSIREFTADARRQYRTLLGLTWAASVSTIAIFAVFLRLSLEWVFRPLRVLVDGSRRVAAGEFDYRIHLDTNDEMSELAGAMNDMTARFQAIRDDLDRQVQERTKQVVRGEQLASVGFLAAGVAHEINNPLASIAMCAESLEGRLRDALSAGDPEQKIILDYLRMIQDEAFRCKGITEKLLDFSRMGDVKRQTTELRELVEGVIDMLGHLGKYQEKQIHLVPGAPVWVSVNPQEIKQVALNLLTNGLDSVEGGGTVTVELGPAGGEAEMIVSDDGCGMTSEVLEHLFEPFFTRRRNGQGTGLGLSITYRIIADHGGTIDAESDGPHRGATFRVRLPLEKAIGARLQVLVA